MFSSYSSGANIFYNLTTSGGYNSAGYGPTGALALDLTLTTLNTNTLSRLYVFCMFVPGALHANQKVTKYALVC